MNEYHSTHFNKTRNKIFQTHPCAKCYKSSLSKKSFDMIKLARFTLKTSPSHVSLVLHSIRYEEAEIRPGHNFFRVKRTSLFEANCKVHPIKFNNLCGRLSEFSLKSHSFSLLLKCLWDIRGQYHNTFYSYY